MLLRARPVTTSKSANCWAPHNAAIGAAREQVVASHLGLVRSVASRYRDLGLPIDDLVQEGSLGLLEAIDALRRQARHAVQ